MSRHPPLDPTLSALELARTLLGRVLVRIGPDGLQRGGVIVETEAYPGGEDLASHSRGGLRTARNRSMYLEGGHVYVYMVYGLHHCLNLVSGPEASGEAVLIRSIRPTVGLDAMRAARPGRSDRELARGPGRLCAALGIDRALDGARLGEAVRIDAGEIPTEVSTDRRIGVDYAGPWAAKPWRFLAGEPRWWSQPLGRDPAPEDGVDAC